MKRVLAVLMENQAGALSRVVGLFSQRGYNIESLIVAPTEDPTLSRLTMTTVGDEKVIQQITKQLNKLIDVVKVLDLSDSDYSESELMIIKLSNHKDTIKKIEELGGSIIYQDETILNVEFIGTSSAMDKVLSTWDDKSLLEVVRTGVLGLSSNVKTLTI
jgi:acetolactate synthase-1/3 small subunit|tara:strand:- start:249 stop:728 length:480 start_codon:yes stop_codon:yes gene_type:complete